MYSYYSVLHTCNLLHVRVLYFIKLLVYYLKCIILVQVLFTSINVRRMQRVKLRTRSEESNLLFVFKLFCIVAIRVQIPDGFWILNTRSVSKRNTKFRVVHSNSKYSYL